MNAMVPPLKGLGSYLSCLPPGFRPGLKKFCHRLARLMQFPQRSNGPISSADDVGGLFSRWRIARREEAPG